MPLPFRAVAASLALLLLLCAGCSGWISQRIAQRIVEPPRSAKQLAWTKRTMDRLGLSFEVLAHPGAPDISYVVVEPGNYGMRYRIFSFEDDTWAVRGGWHAAASQAPATGGTVVLAHGWSMDAGMMLPWAVAFAERGYRAVVVELRSHGRSEPGPMGYGMREAQDVLAVVAHLREQRRFAEPLYLFGVSYGAMTMLHAAAKLAVASGGESAHDSAATETIEPYADPPMAVVAMEPFANAADAIRSMHQFATTALRGSWRRWLLRNSARMLVGKPTLESAISGASRRLELDLAQLDTSVALAATTTCPLLVHGRLDTVVPVRSSRQLAAAHPAAQLVELPLDGHFSTPARVDLLADPIADWFAALQETPECVRFVAPRSTLLGHDGFEKDPVPPRHRAELREPGGAVSVRVRE